MSGEGRECGGGTFSLFLDFEGRQTMRPAQVNICPVDGSGRRGEEERGRWNGRGNEPCNCRVSSIGGVRVRGKDWLRLCVMSHSPSRKRGEAVHVISELF